MHRRFRTPAAISVVALTAALSASSIGAQDPNKQPPTKVAKGTPPAAAQHVMMTPDQMQWGPAPPALPPGAQATILDGDPGKPGLFVVRVKFPDGYAVPPHSHPTDEHVSIVSGTLMMGMGSKVDEASMHAMTAGSYAKMPQKANHYVRAKGETILQITGMGPFIVNYVDSKDDPRKKGN